MHHVHFHFAIVLSLVASFLSGAKGYSWPSPQYDTLEGLLYEGRRGDGSSLSSIIHPCKNRPDTNASIGAEWLRFAFHDMATHDVTDGSGGLDASIAYELGREENFGVGFNHTLSDFEVYSNKYISRSDVIAIGAVFAVASCGGPIIPYRGGRVDALKAGPSGVPEPQQDLASHTESFRRQGFNPSEMITLVACGHTLGGVRSTDFPQLVPPGPNPAVPQFVDFDTTPQFDNAIVTQYLDGSTRNPLVVDSNKTMTSDLRIFTSDSNDTMHQLASPTAFTQSCQSLLERMINTVPHGVSLTDEITLLPVKVSGVQLTFERNNFIFKASLRLLQPTNATVNANRSVKMLWCDRYGSAQNCNGGTKFSSPVGNISDDANIAPITPRLGYSFNNYNFVVPINSTASISKFWFEVDEHDGNPASVYKNDADGYVVSQDQVLFVPTLSRTDYRPGQTYTKVSTIVAAVRDGSNPSRVYMDVYDSAIRDFPAPLNTTVDLKPNSTLPSIAGYSFYSASVEDVGFQMTLDLHSVASDGSLNTEDFRQTTFLDNTPYFAPTNVSIDAKSSSSSLSWGLVDSLREAQRLVCGLAVGTLLWTLL